VRGVSPLRSENEAEHNGQGVGKGRVPANGSGAVLYRSQVRRQIRMRYSRPHDWPRYTTLPKLFLL